MKCCDTTTDIIAGLTSESKPGEVDCADIAIETATTCVSLIKGKFIFKSTIVNNGDDDARSTAGVILLPPNAHVTSIDIKLHKGNQISSIDVTQCRSKITFCIDTSLSVKSFGDKITIRMELNQTTDSRLDTLNTFAIFAYNQLPDLKMENNYWFYNNRESNFNSNPNCD